MLCLLLKSRSFVEVTQPHLQNIKSEKFLCEVAQGPAIWNSRSYVFLDIPLTIQIPWPSLCFRYPRQAQMKHLQHLCLCQLADEI